MKKWFLSILLLLTACLIPSFSASAATQSSDTMIMEWTPQKVWVDKGELLMRGTFKNKRGDLSITKVNEFTTQITFTRSDGTKYQFVGTPKKMPLVKISGNGSRQVTLNLGKFDDTWKDWVATEFVTFTYIDSSRW